MKIPVITIDDNLKSFLSYSAIFASEVKTLEKHDEFEHLFAELVENTRKDILLDNLLSQHNAREVRALFKKIKVDPTKHRPSSEALFRRCHKDGFIPFINNVVAICNYCSLKYLLPMGCYDLDHTGSQLTIRIASETDTYLSLKNIEYNAHGKIIIEDEQGPIGSPIVDSIRASATLESKDIMLLYFIPLTIPENCIIEASELCRNLLLHYASAKEVHISRRCCKSPILI